MVNLQYKMHITYNMNILCQQNYYKMSKKASKILHISSEQQQQQIEQPKIASMGKSSASQQFKYENFKYSSYQLQQNLINSDSAQFQYILPTQMNKNEGKKQKINFVAQQFFDLKDHTIASSKNQYQKAQSELSDKDLGLIKQLDKLNLTNVVQQPNPELRKTARNIKNLLQVQIQDTESEDQKNSQTIKVIGQQQSNQQIQSNHQQQNHNIVIQEITWGPQLTKQQFIFNKLKQNQRLFVKLYRQKSGMNFFLPQFDMILNSDLRNIISCKKEMGTSFQYIISMDNHNFSEKSIYYLGKIVGNFKNSVFNLHDKRRNSIICTTRFRQQPNTSIICPKAFQIFLLNQDYSYSQLAGVQGKQCARGLDELYMIPVNKKKIHYFRNKKPQYNQSLKAYMLNFNGRVAKGSVKNFIIQDSKSGREVLMFGKGKGQSFNLFISTPLNPIIALGIVIPHFASKILQI